MKAELVVNTPIMTVNRSMLNKEKLVNSLNRVFTNYHIDHEEEFLTNGFLQNQESFSIYAWSKNDFDFDCVVDFLFIRESESKFKFSVTDFGMYLDDGDDADSLFFIKYVESYNIIIELEYIESELSKIKLTDKVRLKSWFINLFFYQLGSIRYYFSTKKMISNFFKELLRNPESKSQRVKGV